MLLDIRELRGRLAPDDMYHHVQKYPHYAAQVKIAIVDRDENRPFDALHEALMKNRSFDIQYFHEPTDAERWLLQ